MSKTIKVAICIPVYGMTHAKFTHSLANMLIYSLSHANLQVDGEPATIEFDTYMVSCSMLTESRHTLVASAIQWGADYMLCLDADHIFPPDTLMRLLAHGLPVVGCNYPRRIIPTAPTSAVADPAGGAPLHCYTTKEKAEAGEVEEVVHMGFGVLLFDMRIFDALQAQAERDGDGNFLPLFKFEPSENKIGMIGEDVFFFRKLAEAGVRSFVDHGLSWEVGHCTEIVLNNNHAVEQKEKWLAKKADKKAEADARIAKLEAAETVT